MIRLTNSTKYRGFNYRVVLDSEKRSTNYIERTKGAAYDSIHDVHKCLKCLENIHWIDWLAEGRAKSTCKCGQAMSIEIISFEKAAVSIS